MIHTYVDYDGSAGTEQQYTTNSLRVLRATVADRVRPSASQIPLYVAVSATVIRIPRRGLSFLRTSQTHSTWVY